MVQPKNQQWWKLVEISISHGQKSWKNGLRINCKHFVLVESGKLWTLETNAFKSRAITLGISRAISYYCVIILSGPVIKLSSICAYICVVVKVCNISSVHWNNELNQVRMSRCNKTAEKESPVPQFVRFDTSLPSRNLPQSFFYFGA
jgi:hypothetical protein